MVGTRSRDAIRIDDLMRLSLCIWDSILVHNKGVSYKFMLDKLLLAEDNMFVDASGS